MQRTARMLGTVATLATVLFVTAAAEARAAAESAPPLAGEWQLTTSFHGNDLSERLTFTGEKGALAGTLFRRGKRLPLRVTVERDALRFEVDEGPGGKSTFVGRLAGAELSGTVTTTGGDQWGEDPPYPWRARRATTDRPAAPRVLDFAPTEFHRAFSPSIAPVLRVWPGDTIRTTTVDAAGVDEHGKSRSLGGNPQTGPFFVEGAMPGDVLVVHVKKLRLNRPSAISDDAFVSRAVTADYAEEHKQSWNDVAWTLDLAAGTARPAKPTAGLAHLVVPTRPMLGCVGVAPGFGSPPIRTGDSGRFGGNMDFNEIVEGATVFLPVGQPGALLYVGDGHAVQGDGELNGNALETSLAVEISVDLVHETRIGSPRVETVDHVMAMGLAGSLDEAFREATSELAAWLEKDWGLTGAEAAILMGPTVEYRISEVADRNAGIVAKLAKKYLPKKKEKP